MYCYQQGCLGMSGLAAQNSPIPTSLEWLDLVYIFQLLAIIILF